MPTLDRQFELPAPREAIFDALLDTERYAEWNPMHDSWPDGAPEVVVGRRFVQRTRAMGRTLDTTWTVERLEAPASLVLCGDAPMGMTVRTAYELSDGGASSTLEVRSDIDGGPRALRSLVSRRGESAIDETVAQLSAHVAGAQPLTPVEEPSLRGDVWQLLRWPLEQPWRAVRALLR